jgi:hypothetical protein
VNANVVGKAYKFNIVFRDLTLTAHAGIVLMRDFIGKLGISELIDANVFVKARERGYPESENILSLCWNAILGGDCLLDLNVLRGDSGLPELLGVESVMAPTTAGEFLGKFTIGKINDLQRVLRQASQQARPLQKSDRVTIDFDASLYEQCSKRKQGSRMNYKGQIGYYPLFAFWAEEGEMLKAHLLAGNRRASSIATPFFKQVIAQAPEGRPLALRADSEFYLWDLIEFCEGFKPRPIIYAITANQTEALMKPVAALPEESWKRYSNGQQVAEMWYAPDRRPPHRYLIKRTKVKDKKGVEIWRYHIVITNDHRRTPKQLMEWALKRCGVENRIKEHKNDFGFEKMPSKKYHANWAWLLISQLAWNLFSWFKRLCLPEACQRMTLGTLRHRLLKIAAKIVHQSRQLFLVLSKENYFQDWWSFALKQLAQLTATSP